MSDEALFRVVRGTPTDEELAALAVVLAAKAAAGPAPAGPPPSAWASSWARRREPLAPGAGAWRASGLPR